MSVLVFFNSDSEVNIIHPTFAQELRLPIKPTDLKAQKIDGTMLDIYEIVVAAFLVINKANWVRFFEETFLVANISLEIVFGMFFLTLSSEAIDFLNWELRWRIYITKKAFSTTKRIELIGKKEFVAAALDLEHKTFVIHVASLFAAFFSSIPLDTDIHPFYKPQIVSLIAKKTFIKCSDEYVNFADIFSRNLVSKLPKYIKINNYAIKMVNCQQPSYRSIYSLGLIELKTLKTYIKTNLFNRFIRPSKSLASASIFFNWKSNRFFQLCINYKSLNNLIIKNQYLLSLVGELLNRLRKAR